MNKCEGIKILELDPKRILDGYVAGNSEKRGQQFIRSYVSSRDGQAADEEFAVVNYFDKTEAGQVVALNPIT